MKAMEDKSFPNPKYVAYATTENGEGLTRVIWEGDDINDFRINTSIFATDVEIVIEENKEE